MKKESNSFYVGLLAVFPAPEEFRYLRDRLDGRVDERVPVPAALRRARAQPPPPGARPGRPPRMAPTLGGLIRRLSGQQVVQGVPHRQAPTLVGEGAAPPAPEEAAVSRTSEVEFGV